MQPNHTGNNAGRLFVVATPIGNLEDMTVRAVNTLKAVDMILAEDTRLSRRLLTHYDINAPMLSCHEHNETQRAEEVLQRLNAGQSLALISDAGTPAVSDPGYRLVKAVAQAGFAVTPIPGPNAAVTAISASGLPSNNFAFIGFAPKKAKARNDFLRQYLSFPGTLIFYESPHRTADLLADLETVFGDKPAVLARELTKIYEEFLRGSLSEISTALNARGALKGECVVLLDNSVNETAEISAEDLAAEITAMLEAGATGASAIAKTLAQKHGLAKTDVYQQILRIKNDGN